MRGRKAHTTISRSVQDFLKGVYTLQERMACVPTTAIAEFLSISPTSVTDMARRLCPAGLIHYEKYHGIRLTDVGTEQAVAIVRRHRLLKLYLANELGYPLHEVHQEAGKMEHAVSDKFIAVLVKKLDNPLVDPFGEAIPGVDGTIVSRDLHPLVTLPVGKKAAIARITSDPLKIVEHLLSKGFALGASVKVISYDPFEGPLTVLLNGSSVIVGHTVASAVSVEYQEV